MSKICPTTLTRLTCWAGFLMEPECSARGPSEDTRPADRLERVLGVLRHVAEVSGVCFYQRQQRQKLNKSVVKLRLRGKPLTVHCNASHPNLVDAAEVMLQKVTGVVGEGAVAAAQQLVAQRAADAAEPPAAPVSRPNNFFEASQRKQKLDRELKAANERVLSADSVVKAAQHEVGMLAKAVQLAELQLESAQEKAAKAQQHGVTTSPRSTSARSSR